MYQLFSGRSQSQTETLLYPYSRTTCFRRSHRAGAYVACKERASDGSSRRESALEMESRLVLILKGLTPSPGYAPWWGVGRARGRCPHALGHCRPAAAQLDAHRSRHASRAPRAPRARCPWFRLVPARQDLLRLWREQCESRDDASEGCRSMCAWLR